MTPNKLEYRWTNASCRPNCCDDDFRWKLVVTDHDAITVEQAVARLASIKWNGAPCYEVRTLYAATTLKPTPGFTKGSEIRCAANAAEKVFTTALVATGVLA
jgi:hypothetical protein